MRFPHPTAEEVEEIALKSAENAGISDDISLLAQEILQLEQAVDKTTATIQQQVPQLARVEASIRSEQPVLTSLA